MTADQSMTRQSLVRAEIVATAARVFAERGFRKATLGDIASSLGISRASLYHYVDGKEDLLEQVIGDVSERHARMLAGLADRSDLTPTEKLVEATRHLVLDFGANANVMRVFLREEVELPPHLLARHVDWKAQSDSALRRIMTEGVEQGVFRPVNTKIAAFAVFGMTNWLHVWYQPDGDMSLEEIADAFADLVVAAVSVADTNRPPMTLEQTVLALHSAVDQLDEHVAQVRRTQRNKSS
ncbi:TetR/AcrR family transcriptional regulator [Nocardioides sp. TF02-7]|uniref:TetR/AcrR family transcriptional regulator n=1 Tax=Nocardioides sp. TF02-7 TaxID=2917724 RepID=UPI001F050805|nr:TetR/AcrR family transcriptional regulator [Nocardioides sp. TF02-7]UMG91185.1 TetR/AcrR family transcriptional regulator [Nocardioides sp. TF02-7]